MNSLIPDAMAQAAPAGAPQGGGLSMLVMMGLFVVIFYFLLIRPQQKKQKEHQAMLAKLAAGDEVITSGGIVGKISEISDNFVTVEISEGVRIKVQRFHVTSLVPKGTLKGA
jgi:preprotein translocase subunit YajC